MTYQSDDNMEVISSPAEAPSKTFPSLGKILIAMVASFFLLALNTSGTWSASSPFGVKNLRSTTTDLAIAYHSDLGAVTNMISQRSHEGETFKVTVTGACCAGTIWGSPARYTDDSALSVAAVHAGEIVVGETKDLFVKVLGHQSSFAGTLANGITSHSYGGYHAYKFISEEKQCPSTSLHSNTLTGHRSNVGTIYEISVTGTSSATVWGTDIYTDDSDIRTAAVHAGLLHVGHSKTLHVKTLGSQSSFTGSGRHGVTTHNYGAWAGSYEFVSCGAEPSAAPTDTPVPEPTDIPVAQPTEKPVAVPTGAPISVPTDSPVADPTLFPTLAPTAEPTKMGHIICPLKVAGDYLGTLKNLKEGCASIAEKDVGYADFDGHTKAVVVCTDSEAKISKADLKDHGVVGISWFGIGSKTSISYTGKGGKEKTYHEGHESVVHTDNDHISNIIVKAPKAANVPTDCSDIQAN